MAAEDYCPLLMPGEMLTARASGVVHAGDPLAISGPGEVARVAVTGNPAFVGIAAVEALTGDSIMVMLSGAVQEALADGDIAAGDLLTISPSGGVGGAPFRFAGRVAAAVLPPGGPEIPPVEPEPEPPEPEPGPPDEGEPGEPDAGLPEPPDEVPPEEKRAFAGLAAASSAAPPATSDEGDTPEPFAPPRPRTAPRVAAPGEVIGIALTDAADGEPVRWLTRHG
jgi:hypothetical protein